MVISLKTSINNVIDEDNIFSFDISIFDYVIQSKIDINELNFSRILNGTTNILCISLYIFLFISFHLFFVLLLNMYIK